MIGLDQKAVGSAGHSSGKNCHKGGVRPWNRTGLRGGFDRLPGVVILELRWAEIAER
jgi:hypothetical protein